MVDKKYINENVPEDSENYFDFQKYCNDYKKATYKRITALIPRSNKEMIAHLEKQKSVSSYIYNLIQQDMEKNSK